MNLHIKDSYQIRSVEEIRARTYEYYRQGRLDTCRSRESYVREWFAHNFLYYCGLFKSHTRDVDLNSNETFFRRSCFTLIYYLFHHFYHQK